MFLWCKNDTMQVKQTRGHHFPHSLIRRLWARKTRKKQSKETKSELKALAMNSTNSTFSLNAALVHPPFFFISGLSMPHAKYYYVFLCFVFVVSVLGNSFVMFSIYKERSFHTPKYMAVFNLSLADLGESAALIPNLIAMFLFDSQYISFDACLANMFFVFFFTCLQSLSLAVLAYDRLVAICLPLRYHAINTMPSMAVILTVVWAYNSVLLFLMVSLVPRLSFCKSIVVESYFCDHGPIFRMACNNNHVNIIMGIVVTVLLFCVPFFFTVLSYLFIARALFKIASWEGRLKAMKTCSAHLILVAVYYLPILYTYVSPLLFRIHPNVRIMSTSFAKAIIPMMNPIIYVLSTEEVKEFSKKLFKRKTCNHNRNIFKNKNKGMN
ncbi:olfactory receptor 52E4-like [Anguilla anguilla]|uniref:olfactory receptor 52E4-like n=1 Tax=Anguilla anguilla TaxID=7936 RepID=UPI0015B05092|nr:olfactory receptor 52E4-like [Anguilla anguilla]